MLSFATMKLGSIASIEQIRCPKTLHIAYRVKLGSNVVDAIGVSGASDQELFLSSLYGQTDKLLSSHYN